MRVSGAHADHPALALVLDQAGGAQHVEVGGQRGRRQVEALAAIGVRLDAAGGAVVPEEATICCYAQSDKLWTEDPQGTRWETFHTTGEATQYHAPGAPCATDGASCSPDIASVQPKTGDGAACCGPKSACC